MSPRLPPPRTNAARLAKRLQPAARPRAARGVVTAIAGNKATVTVVGASRTATIPAHLSVGVGDTVALEYTPGTWTVTGVPARGA